MKWPNCCYRTDTYGEQIVAFKCSPRGWQRGFSPCHCICNHRRV